MIWLWNVTLKGSHIKGWVLNGSSIGSCSGGLGLGQEMGREEDKLLGGGETVDREARFGLWRLYPALEIYCMTLLPSCHKINSLLLLSPSSSPPLPLPFSLFLTHTNKHKHQEHKYKHKKKQREGQRRSCIPREIRQWTNRCYDVIPLIAFPWYKDAEMCVKVPFRLCSFSYRINIGLSIHSDMERQMAPVF